MRLGVIRISSFAFVVFVASFQKSVTSVYLRELESGRFSPWKVANQPGWEKWNSEGKDGELNALVGKRFLVTIEGNQIADTKVLHDIAGKVDMNRLAALK